MIAYGMVPFEHNDFQFRGKINTFTGDQIRNNSVTRIIDDYSPTHSLSKEMQVIHVANGDQGTVAIKIPLANITEGKPVLITVGKLNSGTTVYAKDNQSFYVYHTGKNDLSSDWTTANDGVETLYRAHTALKEGGLSNVSTIMSNNDVPRIFSANSLNPYQQSTITYHGKVNTKMPDIEYTQTIFDHNDIKAPLSKFSSTGYSYALLSRSNDGELKIATSSEELSLDRKKIKSLKYRQNTFGSSATEVPDYLSLKTLDKWKKIIQRKNYRKLDLVEVSRLLDRADYYSPQPKLKVQLEEMLLDPKFDDSIKSAMKEIVHTLRRNQPFTSKMIDDYVDTNVLELFPLNEGGDLSILRIRELRIKILKQSMKEASGYSPYKLEVQGGVEGLAMKGVNQSDKQWIGRGECEKASMFFTQDAQRLEIRGGNNSSTITWNHFYNPKSDGTWIDSTWKQFFELSNTRGKNPIFEGSIEDFRNLGLPEESTYQYLLFLNKIKKKDSFPPMGSHHIDTNTIRSNLNSS
jgi:hypothetical protein